MKSITIRGIDPGLDQVIKSRAKQNNLSVNQWVLRDAEKGHGYGERAGVQEAYGSGCFGWRLEQGRGEGFSEKHSTLRPDR